MQPICFIRWYRVFTMEYCFTARVRQAAVQHIYQWELPLLWLWRIFLYSFSQREITGEFLRRIYTDEGLSKSRHRLQIQGRDTDVRFVEERNWMMKILISDFAQSVMEIMNIVQTICSHISMLKNLCKEKKKWQLLILLRYWVL